ncbi:hypothetical protein [Spirosoma pulveris]
MNTTVLLIGLTLLIAWYIRDRFLEKNSKSPAPGDYRGVVLKRPGSTVEDKQLINNNPELAANPTNEPMVGRVYYGIPGQSYKGYIWKGRIFTERR